MWAVIISLAGSIGGIIVDKIALSLEKVDLKKFIIWLFFFLWLFTIPLVIFDPRIETAQFFSWPFLILFFLMLALAVTWNYFYYRGLRHEKLYQFEMIVVLTPVITILLAGIFYPAEAPLRVFIAAVIAGLALMSANFKKAHFGFDQYSLSLVLCVFLIGLENIIIRHLLDAISPPFLYFLRTAMIFAIFSFIWRPATANVSKKGLFYIIFSSIFGVMYMVARFYGYQQLGIVMTTLILILGPVLIFLASAMVFKERIKKRAILAFAVILVCVLYSVLAQNEIL